MTDLLALDPFSLLQDRCALAIGVLLVPARPGTRGAGVIFNDVLTALGKNAAGCGAISHRSGLSELTGVWLRAERIHTVVLHAADRVTPGALSAAQEALSSVSVDLVPLGRESAVPELPVVDLPPHQRPPAELAHLSRAVQPYFAAAGLLEALTGSWDGLDRIMLTDVDEASQTISVLGRDVTIPAGAWRYIDAQRLHSVDNAQPEFFTMFGSRLDRSRIVFGSIKALSL